MKTGVVKAILYMEAYVSLCPYCPHVLLGWGEILKMSAHNAVLSELVQEGLYFSYGCKCNYNLDVVHVLCRRLIIMFCLSKSVAHIFINICLLCHSNFSYMFLPTEAIFSIYILSVF